MAAPAITLAELAVHLRISADPATAPGEPYAGVLTDLMAYGVEVLAEYAPDAPVAAADMALVSLVGYIADRPTTWRRFSYSDAFRNSGCQTMLADYHVPVWVKI